MVGIAKVQTRPGVEGQTRPVPAAGTSRVLRDRGCLFWCPPHLFQRAASANSLGFSMARCTLAQHGAHGFLPWVSAQLLQPWPGAGTTFVSRELEQLPPWKYTPREVSFPPDKTEVPGLAALDRPALAGFLQDRDFKPLLST